MGNVLQLSPVILPTPKDRPACRERAPHLDVAAEMRERENVQRLVPAAPDVAVAKGREIEIDLILEVAAIGRERELDRRATDGEALKQPCFDLPRTLRLERWIRDRDRVAIGKARAPTVIELIERRRLEARRSHEEDVAGIGGALPIGIVDPQAS